MATAGQALPQAPQEAGEVRSSASQPLPAAPSQLPKPVSQVTPQAPERQAPRACGPSAQAVPQAPQWAGSRASSASQPLLGWRSQSA
ncbi:MAG: hypothetical protein IPN17_17515 [Deltaproteobacteria bacterium]|nr:hypothetical protein [Deltaproteobacteria bacterium]